VQLIFFKFSVKIFRPPPPLLRGPKIFFHRAPNSLSASLLILYTYRLILNGQSRWYENCSSVIIMTVKNRIAVCVALFSGAPILLTTVLGQGVKSRGSTVSPSANCCAYLFRSSAELFVELSGMNIHAFLKLECRHHRNVSRDEYCNSDVKERSPMEVEDDGDTRSPNWLSIAKPLVFFSAYFCVNSMLDREVCHRTSLPKESNWGQCSNACTGFWAENRSSHWQTNFYSTRPSLILYGRTA
jgi:hypothetical protein